MGNPWHDHHSDDYPPYSVIKSYISEYGNTYSTDIPLGPMSNIPWPHQRTSSSLSSWPVKASEHHSSCMSSSNLPLPHPTPFPQKSMSNGALAAAIAVPILTFLSAIALVFLCLRRSRRASAAPEPTVVTISTMKEKFGSFRSHSSRNDAPLQPRPLTEPPVLTSQQNNSYLTGLDTSSLGSREDSGDYQARGSFEPPPPYVRGPSPPAVDMRARSPFEDSAEDRRVSDPFVSPIESPASSESPSGVGH